jgi:hypothetical protein
VNIMSKVTYKNLFGGPLHATFICLHMADQTIRFLEGLAKDILVKIHDDYVPMNFVVLDTRLMKTHQSSLEGHSSTL